MQQSRSIGFGHSVTIGTGPDAVTYGRSVAFGRSTGQAGTPSDGDFDARRDDPGSEPTSGPYDPDHARWRTDGGGGSGSSRDFEE